jgi:hypothetical protein
MKSMPRLLMILTAFVFGGVLVGAPFTYFIFRNGYPRELVRHAIAVSGGLLVIVGALSVIRTRNSSLLIRPFLGACAIGVGFVFVILSMATFNYVDHR